MVIGNVTTALLLSSSLHVMAKTIQLAYYYFSSSVWVEFFAEIGVKSKIVGAIIESGIPF